MVISKKKVVFYTFFNQRTRRADVGVITLHEGMIDKNGITASHVAGSDLVPKSLVHQSQYCVRLERLVQLNLIAMKALRSNRMADTASRIIMTRWFEIILHHMPDQSFINSSSGLQ